MEIGIYAAVQPLYNSCGIFLRVLLNEQEIGGPFHVNNGKDG